MDAESLEIVRLGAILLGAGAAAGLLAGLLGVGGGIVIVPTLYWMAPSLDLPPAQAIHIAVATSLATIIPTSISSMRAHWRRGAVDADLLRLWAPGVLVGAGTGGIVAGFLNGGALAGVFGCVAIAVAVNMAIARPLVIADALPVSAWVNRAIAGTIGLISAFMGIGGGTLSVPTLTLYGFPIHRAVGTASVFGLVIAVPAVCGYVVTGWSLGDPGAGSFGYVNLPIAAVLALATVFLAPVGARLAHRLPKQTLKRCFAVFLALTAARMLT